MWSIHRWQKSKHITPTPKRPPLGTPPAAARQLKAQWSVFIVGECCRAQRILNPNDCQGIRAIRESPLRLRRGGIRKGTSRAPSPTGGSDNFRPFFNYPEGIHSCAMAQFMVKPIHARKGNSLAIGRRPYGGIVNRGGGRCRILEQDQTRRAST